MPRTARSRSGSSARASSATTERNEHASPDRELRLLGALIPGVALLAFPAVADRVGGLGYKLPFV